MLNFLKKCIEVGRISIERKNKYIIWYIESKKDIYKIINILDKYPLLTSRKICQLEFLKKYLENRDLEKYLNEKDFKFDKQNSIINYYNNNFIIPDYFKGWLSGFIEAEGNFSVVKYKTGFIKKRQFNIGQNLDEYLIKAIKVYLNSNHKICSKQEKNSIFLHYRISIGGSIANNNLINHFKLYPLLGNKLKSYDIWLKSFNITNFK